MTAPAWACDACGESMPPELADAGHFPRCPSCGWPADQPHAAHEHEVDGLHPVQASLTSRELKARQAVLAAGELDVWRAKFEQYHTTADSCGCPDYQIRGVARGEIESCKHMIAWRLLLERVLEREAEAA